MADWDEVLDFWLPDTLDEDMETHHHHWLWRMTGGATGDILARFTTLTEQVAAGRSDCWAGDPRGRLALIIVLDQFSRSVWQGTPRAYAQDEKALALALEGYENGHYAALTTPWEKTVYNLPLGHCEGADHLERLALAKRLGADIIEGAPPQMKEIYVFTASQANEVNKVIAAFGRHPHRNAVLGRPSTAEEVAYIAAGQFPHLRAPRN